MSNKMNVNNQLDKRHISDLLDGHCDSQALDELLESESQRECWHRYNMVSAVLSKEHSVYSSMEFTKAIAGKIEEEPAIIAKPRKSKPSSDSKPRVLQFWKRAGGGLAVAASVAYATVFSVQMMNTASEGSGIGDLGTVAVQSAEKMPAHSKVFVSSAEAQQQAKLDEIQSIINNIGSHDLKAYEQQVGGEWIYRRVVDSSQLGEKELTDGTLEPLKTENND